jgi:hypothetical protein
MWGVSFQLVYEFGDKSRKLGAIRWKVQGILIEIAMNIACKQAR